MTEEQLQKLERLSQLKKDGILTEAELEEQKRIILGKPEEINNLSIRKAAPANNSITKDTAKKDTNPVFVIIVLIVFFFILIVTNFNKKPIVNEGFSAVDTTAFNITPIDTIAIKRDSTIIKEEQMAKQKANRELKTYLRASKDEFNDRIWYYYKNSPKYVNSNGIYVYFQTIKGIPDNLRFRMQYYADDWLFIENMQFLIDDQTFTYTPAKVDTDSGDGGYIWEWFDEPVGYSNRDIIEALANAKVAKMKLNGRQYHKIKVISKDQISGIKKVLEIYDALNN